MELIGSCDHEMVMCKIPVEGLL